MTEDFVIKYAWSAVSVQCPRELTCFARAVGSSSSPIMHIPTQAGYLLISIPVFFGDVLPAAVVGEKKDAKKREQSAESAKVAVRTESELRCERYRSRDSIVPRKLTCPLHLPDYISNRRLLLALADAGGRLMSSYKDMAQLAGYTSRVYNLLSTLHELDTDHYQSVPRPADLDEKAPFYDLGHINGVVVDGIDGVEFEHVPIVAPAPGLPRGGEELVKSLDVNVKPGEHLLITGANVSDTSGILASLRCFPVTDPVHPIGNRQDELRPRSRQTLAGVRRHRPSTKQRRHHVLAPTTLSQPR